MEFSKEPSDGLRARAAELFFRAQRVSIEDGAIRLADDETVEMHAASGGLGNLGKLIQEAQMPLRSIELDVLDAKTHAEYWKRDERYDTVLQINSAHAGCAALCRVIEAWVAHFHQTPVTVSPVREIPDEEWVWHVGLDAEATAMLNEIYNGGDVDDATHAAHHRALPDGVRQSVRHARRDRRQAGVSRPRRDTGQPVAHEAAEPAREPAAREARVTPHAERFMRIVAGPDEEINLAEAALLIATEEYRDLDIAAYLARLNNMAATLKRRLRPDITPADTIILLNRYLFDEHGFTGNAADYYDPRNSFLNEVLDRKRGIPLTLAIVYIEIGRRIGLPVQGVSFPAHFLVKCKLREGTVVLDPYAQAACR